MKMIKISTDNQITVQDFPEGNVSERNEQLCRHIGEKCELTEHVMPKRLYTEL